MFELLNKKHREELRMRHDYEADSEERARNMQNDAKSLWKERQLSKKNTRETYKEVCNQIKREFVSKKKNKKQPWITEEMLETMEERKMKRSLKIPDTG